MRRFHAAFAAAILLAGCGDGTSPTSVGPAIPATPITPATPVTPVNVGFLVSGVRTYANGAMIAVEEANADGGLSGRPVELMVEMDLEEAAAAVEAAERMILDAEVAALIGPNRSAHAIEVGAVAQRHGVPMITTAATNPGVTAAGDLVFMAAFTDQFQGRVMADFAFETLGARTAAVLTQRGEVYSEGIGEFFVDHFRRLGGTVAADLSYERGATDFAAPLTNIAAAAPAVVFMPGSAEEAVFLTAQGARRAAPRCRRGADGVPGSRCMGQRGAPGERARLRGRQLLQHPLLAGHGRTDRTRIRRGISGAVRDRPPPAAMQ